MPITIGELYMANATRRDARAGFDIYRHRNGNIDLESLNIELYKSGYNHIAQRTLNHYQNLIAAGFNRYISINRFDVARASRPYEDMSKLGRYRYRTINQPVRVKFSKNERDVEIPGRIVKSGDVGAIITFPDESVLEELRNHIPRPNMHLNLCITNAANNISAVVVECDLTSSPGLLEVEYNNLVSLAEIIDPVLLQNVSVKFTLESENSNPVAIDVIGKQLYSFFDLIEGVRALLNEAELYSEEIAYAAPPIVQEIRVASPAIIILQIPIELLEPLAVFLSAKLFVRRRETRRKFTYKERQTTKTDPDTGMTETSRTLKIKGSLPAKFLNSRIPDSEIQRIYNALILPEIEALLRSGIRGISHTQMDTHDHDISDDY